jgi:hypothetical protein
MLHLHKCQVAIAVGHFIAAQVNLVWGGLLKFNHSDVIKKLGGETLFG